MKKNLIYIIAGFIIVAGASFYGGLKYGQTQKSTFAGGNFNLERQGNFMPANGSSQKTGSPAGRVNTIGAGLINGEIISKDDKTLTVKLVDGNSKIILYSTSTAVGKSVEAKTEDLTSGQNISVMGRTNDDGSITAQNIQIKESQAIQK